MQESRTFSGHKILSYVLLAPQAISAAAACGSAGSFEHIT